MKHVWHSAMAAIVAVAVVGCKDDASTSSASRTPVAAVTATALPANLLLTTAPQGASEVAALREAAQDGAKVVVQGVVGGRSDPIASNRAILTLLDISIPTCDKNPDDGCSTPWDACCEPADVRAKNSITVQVIDDKGQPVAASLATLAGVKPLAHIAVTGTATVTADGAVLVNADGIYVIQ